MRTLIVGAGGYLGAAVAGHLAAAGHQVAALARSPERAAEFAARGYATVIGDLPQLADLKATLAAFDAIVLAGAIAFEQEWDVAEALLSALAGSPRLS
jgi:uncharacterized protein YbjT (DUF2867 family)